ncbi:MAG TPA: MoaD/ThiS family protein [Candidatus Binatia bacterium]|nr:MoaD/ThiS family protein [Candidatus Binatia bacterium]
MLPAPLRPLADGAAQIEVQGSTLGAVFDDLAARLPILERRLRDERGQIRPHVLVFVDGAGVRGEGCLSTPVRDGAEVFVAPAVSGG